MIIGCLAGAAAALVLALLFITRPRIAYRAAQLFERVGEGRGDAVLRLLAAFAVVGAILGAFARA